MDEDRDKDTRGFGRRYGPILLGGVLLLAGAGWGLSTLAKGGGGGPRKPAPLVAITLPPPPPAVPTPPPPPPPPTEQKMVEQEKVEENEPKPDERPKEAPAASTGIKGSGTDAFGLRGGGSNGLGGEPRRGSNSKWGWYAGQVQGRIASALRSHARTRNSRFDGLTVRIWADNTGRVTRAALGSSSGDAALDAALRNEILTGLQLTEAPPAGMPMPIVLRVSARRPN